MLLHSVVLAVALFALDASASCSCGGCAPCKCMVCHPLPPPCPPPVICPAPVCPACAPPPPCPTTCVKSVPVVVNTCCNTCASPCGFRARRRRSVVDMMLKVKEEDPVCNSQPLRKIILESITEDLTESRERIQKKAMAQLKERLNVICAKGDISYFAYTEMFCQTSKLDVTCYAFKPAS